MKKSDYKLFFYIGDKPVNINLKEINNSNPSQLANEVKNKILNQDNQKNLYNKAKQNYDYYLKRNKNLLLLNKKSTSGKITSKDYLENRDNSTKEAKKNDLSLLPFVPNKKENFKNIEELKKLQRNTVTMRRIEYSMKVKNAENKKKYKNNIKKIIIIQKWVRGFLLRNLLSNLSYFEVFTNEFLDHIKKFVFLRHDKYMKNIIKYFENKLFLEEEKRKNNEDKKIRDNKENNGIIFSKNEAMSFGENSNNNKKSLDVIKENSNERYIDEDSIMEYNNNRNKNRIDNNINNNILFLSSKDFSDKNLINSNNNYINNNSNILLDSNNNNNFNLNNNITDSPFILNESSIVYEERNKKYEEKSNNKNNNKNDTLNSNKEDIFSTLKNEEIRDVFNAKHTDNLVMPSPALINNMINNETNINNNNDLFIKRPKLNRKFIEEISNAPNTTPIKKEDPINKNDENKNIFKKIEVNFLEKDNNINIENNNEKIKDKNKDNNIKINNYINNRNEMEKEIQINENGKKNKFERKINYINSLKSNQFSSLSNPNTTKENTSTLDSNTLNINRKLILDENISISSNTKTILEKNNNNLIKPINKPMYITKIRLNSNAKIEYLIIKYSKTEKKLLPKIFDLNYIYSQEISEQDDNINNIKDNSLKDKNSNNNNVNKKILDNNNINIGITNINKDNNNKINIDNSNNDVDKSISNDININVLNVVNNNIDELNSSIKNIVKEECPAENNQNKLNPFGKSLRALLELDKPINNNNLINNNETEINIMNKEEKEEKEEEKGDINIENNNIDNIENRENPMDILNQMSIEEIKEVKEEYEDEKESELNFTQKKLYNSNEIVENSKENDYILDSNKNLIRKSLSKNLYNNDFVICSQNITYNIIPEKNNRKSFDKSQIFIVILLAKQIKFNIKPYIFNLLKKMWKEKLNK